MRFVYRSWHPDSPGLLRLPSGRLVRGRSLRRPMPAGPSPDFGVYLLARRPPELPWESRWLRWPDFRLPADPAAVRDVLTEVLRRSAAERVEICCTGGRGRTGTALACLAILDGVPAAEAVGFVRAHYHPHAVETPAQRSFVARWQPAGAS
jgi:Protein-tyrosine phosphatase